MISTRHSLTRQKRKAGCVPGILHLFRQGNTGPNSRHSISVGFTCLMASALRSVQIGLISVRFGLAFDLEVICFAARWFGGIIDDLPVHCDGDHIGCCLEEHTIPKTCKIASLKPRLTLKSTTAARLRPPMTNQHLDAAHNGNGKKK